MAPDDPQADDAANRIPKPAPNDHEDVSWALSTAEATWRRGERTDALRWLRRAAASASDAQQDERALEIAKAAAELAAELEGPSGPDLTPEAAEVVPLGDSATGGRHETHGPFGSIPRPERDRRSERPAAPKAEGSSPAPRRASRPPPARASEPPRPRGSDPAKRRISVPPPAPKTKRDLEQILETASKARGSNRPRSRLREALEDGARSGPHEVSGPESEDKTVRYSSMPGRQRDTMVESDFDATREAHTLGTNALDAVALEAHEQHETKIGRPAYRGDPPPEGVATPEPSAEARASQAVRVVVWRDQHGVRVAPAGTTVSAISVDAMLVALDPTADLSAWLNAK